MNRSLQIFCFGALVLGVAAACGGKDDDGDSPATGGAATGGHANPWNGGHDAEHGGFIERRRLFCRLRGGWRDSRWRDSRWRLTSGRKRLRRRRVRRLVE